ncbi:sensor histidine kinase [Sporolactobacillus putidus]|uniref:histidine kinase n=1 Tax=Sporolactobacillus putidus TaxID=492735 RepID=A0A917RZP0_9BACL|nr:sensor histidine kinase [Sporolactobacillus putidus]GGL45228.1 two-component sensor histidine kinase [Sporolactobacillus putidus]
MSIKDYLKDQAFLLVFYIVSMTFITVYLYLEPLINLKGDSLIYLHAVILFLFLVYLSYDYLRRSRYLSALKKAAELSTEDRLVSMPAPRTTEQASFLKILQRIDQDNKQMVQKLQLEIEENKDFVMSWVHEVKTPIAAGRMLIGNSEGKKKEQLLDKLENEFEQIDHFVEQALYYSRTDSFSKDYFISEYPLRTIVHASLKKHAKLFIAKKIKVETSRLDFQVLTDKKWLQFIIDQILSNALKYTDHQGWIAITGKRVETGTELSIEDNGRGIRAEDVGRVFDRGFTGYTGRKERHATGMGLYLSRTLAVKLGHRISLDSREGRGTRVTLYFPNIVDYTGIGKEMPR